jgi:hypothetical protein
MVSLSRRPASTQAAISAKCSATRVSAREASPATTALTISACQRWVLATAGCRFAGRGAHAATYLRLSWLRMSTKRSNAGLPARLHMIT